jgi:hypothetical protein
MFQGTTIDELINTVERAEQKARQRQEQQQQSTAPVPQAWEYSAATMDQRRLN